MSNQGTRVIYITGNHDEALRKYSDFILGNLELVDKVILDLHGKKTWIFHGDVFDSTTQGYAKILAKLGGKGYDLLILSNSIVNWVLVKLGREKRSYSKLIKNSVKKAVSFISNFEKTAAEIAIEKKYDYVICGHIHMPQIKKIETDKGSVTYLNSGDWIENLSALEYKNKKWSLYYYNHKDYMNLDLNEDKVSQNIIDKILA